MVIILTILGMVRMVTIIHLPKAPNPKVGPPTLHQPRTYIPGHLCHPDTCLPGQMSTRTHVYPDTCLPGQMSTRTHIYPDKCLPGQKCPDMCYPDIFSLDNSGCILSVIRKLQFRKTNSEHRYFS